MLHTPLLKVFRIESVEGDYWRLDICPMDICPIDICPTDMCPTRRLSYNGKNVAFVLHL